jgi:hypothetical protein
MARRLDLFFFAAQLSAFREKKTCNARRFPALFGSATVRRPFKV